MSRLTFLAAACLMVVCSVALAQATPAEKTPPSQDELDKRFAETMSGATLVGYFTTGEMAKDTPLKEDRYVLGKVTKLNKGDLWLFESRIQYNGHDTKVALLHSGQMGRRHAGDLALQDADSRLRCL